YVAENRGYPLGAAEGEPPLGKIARLSDTDGDGQYDRRTDFATGLTFPNGVMPWGDGLIVTCAPEILFLRDTDGDGQAEERTVWFTGFSTTGSTQLRVSHPTLGLDNWIYVTSGLSGGNVTCPAHAERPALKFGRTDFRFRPDLSEYETCDGGGQYGLCFDDAGHRFICYNRVQVQHVVLESRSLRRNPHLAFSETVQNCPTDLAPEPLKGHGQGARLFPISANVTTADSHAGTFTAACGVFVWRGGSLPAMFSGGAFSCDPTGNLVHFDALKPHGATFTAEPVLAGREFLASPDNWFRPVFLASGPDEALYICDMYRKTIEHPDYLPVEIRKRTDFESGRGMGRIWRVVNEATSPRELAARREAVKQAATGAGSKVELLKSDGAWARDLGHRLLLTEEPAQRTDLLTLIDEASLSSPTKSHLLSLLAARGQLSDPLLANSMQDVSPAVREQAIVRAESRLASSPVLSEAAIALAHDDDPHVRLQAALALGQVKNEKAVSALATLALRDADDRWTRAAVLSSIAGREVAILDELLKPAVIDSAGANALYTELGRLLGASQEAGALPTLLARVLNSGSDVARRAPLLSGIGESLRSRGEIAAGSPVLPFVLRGDTPELAKTRAQLFALIDSALALAQDDRRDSAARETAVAVLAQSGFETAGTALLALVDPQQPAALQSAALRALRGMSDPQISAALLDADRFAAYSPTVREEVLAAILGNKAHWPGLFGAMESGAVPTSALDTLRRKQFLDSRDSAVRARATRLFGQVANQDRGRIYEDFKSVIALAPQAENGHAVFRKHCANCHRLDREGFAVGPDLFGIRNQPKEAILLHILIPEQEITQGFAAYTIETKDGRILTGLLASETATSVTLRQPLGKEEAVLRSDIERLSASKLSLMPQELEKLMSRQELADLLSYLKGESQRR
ncbi:MAG: PVC-type heme-binding CxxCH protein, partial [Singulisphaera sp.]